MQRKPTVFAVGNTYQIMLPCEKQALMWVDINGKCYYDHLNGVMRSDTKMHRVTVPKKVLDSAGSYTVCVRNIIERKPYFSETEDVVELTYSFKAVPEEGARAFHLSDVHGNAKVALMTAKQFGSIDFLILNGDIINHSGSIDKFDTIFQITEKLTGGTIPVVFSRGNHDLRGLCAENLTDYIPTYNGKTYYTFRLGSIWGILLDCGEDKNDDHPEYGNTICCHSFREEETEFLEGVIENSGTEYEENGVQYRMVVSHVPFPLKRQEPFDIEGELYTKWCNLLKDNVKPDMILSGHTHIFSIDEPKGENDAYGQPCTVVIGSAAQFISHEEKAYLVGTGLTFSDGKIEVSMIDLHGDVVCEKTIIAGNID